MSLRNTRCVILDTETTELNHPKVIELAAMEWWHKRPVQEKDMKESLVNPGCFIHPCAMAVHHITDADVADKPRLEDIIDEWSQWVGDSPIVAYNAPFDRGVLKDTPLYDRPWFDAYRMVMHFWSVGDRNKNGFPLTSLKQQELRYWLGLPPIEGEAHRAGADVMVTSQIMGVAMDAYLACGRPDTWEDFVAFVDAPIMHRTLPVGGRAMVGKTPEEVPDWALRKAFNQDNFFRDAFLSFNILETLAPEFKRRFGYAPTGWGDDSKQVEQSTKTDEKRGFRPPEVPAVPPRQETRQATKETSQVSGRHKSRFAR